MAASAQANKIVGDWTTHDDKADVDASIVHIYKGTDGLYYGKVVKLLVEGKDVCTECTGADKDKPIEGLIIIRGFQEKDGELVGGKVLDPDNGKFYYGKIYLNNKGQLVLRGSLDKMGLLGRSQTWNRKTK